MSISSTFFSFTFPCIIFVFYSPLISALFVFFGLLNRSVYLHVPSIFSPFISVFFPLIFFVRVYFRTIFVYSVYCLRLFSIYVFSMISVCISVISPSIISVFVPSTFPSIISVFFLSTFCLLVPPALKRSRVHFLKWPVSPKQILGEINTQYNLHIYIPKINI